jgi:hypothetical protein
MDEHHLEPTSQRALRAEHHELTEALDDAQPVVASAVFASVASKLEGRTGLGDVRAAHQNEVEPRDDELTHPTLLSFRDFLPSTPLRLRFCAHDLHRFTSLA